MAKNTPAFQYYPTDFLAGVMMISDEACGVYWKLCSSLWVHGNSLPFCFNKLAVAALTTPEVMHRVWPEISDKFIVQDDCVMHARFVKMMAQAEVNRQNGLKGGRPKKQNKTQTETQTESETKPKLKAGSLKNEERSMKNEVLKPEDWEFPENWDQPFLRKALDSWAEMRRKIKKPIRSRVSTSKIFKRFESPEHLAAVAEVCEANEWQGLKPEYSDAGKKNQSVGERSMRQKL